MYKYIPISSTLFNSLVCCLFIYRFPHLFILYYYYFCFFCCIVGLADIHKDDIIILFFTDSPALQTCSLLYTRHHLVRRVVKVPASRAEDPGFESHLRWNFSRVESYQWLQNWHSSGYPARCLALKGQCWDWLAQCQYTVTGWDGKFGLQFLSQYGST